jgi:hypothetical protein
VQAQLVPVVASILIITCAVAGAQKADSEPRKSPAAEALKDLTGMTPDEYKAAEIRKTVKLCVATVHKAGGCWTESGNGNSCSYSEHEFYINFDAFYNPASGTVENNVTLQGERKALFIFKKCMAENGVPLK